MMRGRDSALESTGDRSLAEIEQCAYSVLSETIGREDCEIN